MNTAWDWIIHWAKKKPTKVAIIYNGETFSYEYFATAIEATRRFLEQKLITVGSPTDERFTAIIAIDPVFDAWVTLIAARSLGMDTLCVSRVDGYLVNQSKRISCILVGEQSAKQIHLSDEFPHKDKIVVIPDAIYNIASLRAINNFKKDVSSAGGNFLLSSGTTGIAKRVLIASNIESRVAEVYAKHALLKVSSKSYLLDYNLAAFGGYVYGLSSFKIGATIIADQGNDFLRTFYSTDFDYVTLRPAHIDKLFDVAQFHPPVAKPRLRLHIGGGFVNYRKIEWVIKNITPNVYHIYGATENSGFAKTKIACADDLLWHSIYPHRQLDIVDDDDNIVPDEVEGRLRIKNEIYTANEYFEDPEATAAHFRNGFFYTGDMAIRRQDGRVRILGRVSDVLFIKSDRYAIGPIEDKIQEIAGCLDACVFVRQNAETLTEVFIALEANEPPTEEKNRTLKNMFAMADAVHVSSISNLPKTDGGKTDRVTLRKMLFDRQDTLVERRQIN